MKAARIDNKTEIDAVIKAALLSREPLLIEVNTSLDAILP
jgi:thiamine pyrophosphate-dependent acetolactate synthase large subunit-like protein